MDIVPAFDLSTIYRLPKARSRSISAENPTGGKGAGGRAEPVPGDPASALVGDLGRGWKVRPFVPVPARGTITLAEIDGPGVITHIWTTAGDMAFWRDLVIRIYWDGEPTPSVEVPYGDFFCNGWGVPAKVLSQPINVNPLGGFNSFWPMPFARSARITVSNDMGLPLDKLFYQIDYVLAEIPADSLSFHAQWRRTNPLPAGTDFTIVDGIAGRGRFAGCYLAWGQNSNRWWGEGEVKFFIDGDGAFPTYCGTGTEDYFGGAWGFLDPGQKAYETYSAPYLGYPQLIRPDGFSVANMRHGLYRWHVLDPVFFEQDFRATIQAIGWRKADDGTQVYLPLQDDIAATAVWYQAEPHAPFPALPDRAVREVVAS